LRLAIYFRFPLSFRDVEEMLAMRGVSLSYESVREWCLKFGQAYANGLRRRSPRPGDRWHLDEVFLRYCQVKCGDVIRLLMRHTPPMRTSVSRYHRHRFPAEIISHCVWLYFRFALSFRDVEEMLAMRGVSLTYETIREWCRKFGQTYANGLRRKSPRPGDR
jgi:transposase-like protein